MFPSRRAEDAGTARPLAGQFPVRKGCATAVAPGLFLGNRRQEALLHRSAADISPSARDGCCGHNIEVTKSTGCASKRGSISTLRRPRRRVAQTVPSALGRSNCGGRFTSRLERADQGWGSLIGPMDFANAARSPTGTFGAMDVAPSGAFLDAWTCWKTMLAMNSRNGV